MKKKKTADEILDEAFGRHGYYPVPLGGPSNEPLTIRGANGIRIPLKTFDEVCRLRKAASG